MSMLPDPSIPACEADEIPAFEVRPSATGRTNGLVFASAHSGRHYPQDMRLDADLSSVQHTEDAVMDQLIATAPLNGTPLLLANIGRAYVDLNRATSELDPSLIEDCPVIAPGPKTMAGYGVIHRLGGDRRPLYNRALTMDEVHQRLERVHIPYHQALAELMHQAREHSGRAVLVDWHSMPARATGPNGPDIILGDRHGSSCSAQWTRTLKTLFETQGWKVGLNRPYAGGYATQTWGRPDEGFEALQVEVNRRLYWDESNHTPSIGWKRCQSAMKRVIADFCASADSL